MEVGLNTNRETGKSLSKITVVFLSLIMVFSIGFTVLSFNNASKTSNSISNVNSNVPEALYSKCGESVCFVGSQPIISFGSFKYPVQYDIFQVGTQSDKVASPYVSDSSYPGNVSLVNFNSYHTKEIQNGKCTSADLIRSGNDTQAVDAFFFNSYGISSSVAFQNMINISAVYLVDFTIALPSSNNFSVSGNDVNSVHSLNQNDFLLDHNDSSIKMGGLNINWMCDSNLFHMGEIRKMNGFDALILSFGPIKLAAHETYTIDPNIEPTIFSKPIHKSGGGGGGSGGGSTGTTTYPPTLSGLKISQPSSTCFANGSSDGHVKISYTVTSETSNSPIKEGYFEVTSNGNNILLGTSNAYQCENMCFSTTVNNIGCFKGFEIAYEYPGTSEWTCQDRLGHSFNEYINFTTGYVFPDLQEFPGQGRVIDSSNGKTVAVLSGGATSYAAPTPAHIGDTREICLYQDFLSKGNDMGAIQRSYCFQYKSNSKGIQGQSVGFSCLKESCATTSCDYTPIEFAVANIGVTLLGVVIGGFTGTGIILGTIAIVIALDQYFDNPDHPTITNNVNSDGKLTCCDKSSNSAPNEPYNYFQHGCSSVSNVFGSRFNLCTGTSDCSGNVVEHYNYGESFELFNTSLTGNLCQEEQTYSGTLSSPVYIYFG